MTVYELGDEMHRRRRRHGVPARRAPRRRPDPAGLRLPARHSDVRAVVLTHAHEDHVGALPFLLREIRVQEVWATRLTLGLVKSKLDEHGLLRAAELREVEPERRADRARAVQARVRPHGALDPGRGRHRDRDERPGSSFTRGDWKLDHTPGRWSAHRRRPAGRRSATGGVDLLCGDSTNAERAGFTRSERVVGEAFRQIIPVRRGGYSSRASPRTSTGCSRRSTSPSTPAAGASSSAARCGAT